MFGAYTPAVHVLPATELVRGDTWNTSFDVNPKGQVAYGLVVSGAKAVYSYRQKATLREV